MRAAAPRAREEAAKRGRIWVSGRGVLRGAREGWGARALAQAGRGSSRGRAGRGRSRAGRKGDAGAGGPVPGEEHVGVLEHRPAREGLLRPAGSGPR